MASAMPSPPPRRQSSLTTFDHELIICLPGLAVVSPAAHNRIVQCRPFTLAPGRDEVLLHPSVVFEVLASSNPNEKGSL